ncbi:ribokinase [Caminicella sporogenes]|uniref:ribokinase n=1 Tax=Caminicella sporogenes TaxID=166485 RepID=UPI00253FF2BB|nr:ribokinase [Caminicella sporogenes]WIF95451.1 ribokinase [Caminicella sporogenes]
MKKILVVGSLNMDLVTNVRVTPRVGETVLGRGFEKIPGGKGANQAAAMGRLKGNVKMLGKVGDDSFGEILKNNLQLNNVDISNVYVQKNQSTGIAMIMVNEDGDNSIVVIPGANFDLMPEDIKDSVIRDCDILVSQLEIPLETIEYIFKKAKDMNKYTILNPAPACKLSDNLLENIDLLVLNETEIEVLSDVKINSFEDIIKGSNFLMDKGVKEIIVTLGREGAVYFSNEKHIKFNAYKVTAVDTTAAGDSFIAGLTVKLSKDKDICEAIEFATKVAAITVTRKGAQSSLPTLEEVKNFKGVK